ncbi:hypothetical protein HHK36_012693 [Tetracentron sinense]|uniref:PGG domain-containing protein n=1 Tax=Tetracentron sinense TaxID=13715 RepID=A0A835DIE5_TETSI|nr:hypothetical protein HHK36_012693 [Tetracentron sinense]
MFSVQTSNTSSPPKPLLIVTPTNEGKYPVLLFLHGFYLHNCFYTDLLKHIASHGFIAVAPQLEEEGDKGSELHSMEDIKESMFENAMKGQWVAVVTAYQRDVVAQEAMITRSGDTALHVAVSDGQIDVVWKLVDAILDQNVSKVLKIKNERGNTPLHLAASMGIVEMCECLAKRDPALVGERNLDSETPLFLAALHGKKDAFLCLYSKCREHELHDDANLYCRRNDGETILHCAISGDYFALAFQIIRLYKELINYKNQNGVSPLHILASIFVDELKEESQNRIAYPVKSGDEKSPMYPQNYQTCVDFFRYLMAIFTTFGKKVEEPQKTGASSSARHHLVPSNYTTCFIFFKLVMKTLLVVLGVGFKRIKTIQEKKEKHTWAVQIMEELIEHASVWKYNNDGSDPRISNSHGDNQMRPIHIDGPSTSNSDIPQKLAGEEIDKRKGKGETPILMAAMMGVTEIVEKILDKFPVAVQDLNSDGKNILLLAVENRQPHIYQLLLKRKILRENVFRKVDSQGNSALHLAAMLGEYRPWLIPGAALQMQWEIKCPYIEGCRSMSIRLTFYTLLIQFVKDSMPPHFFVRYDKNGKTPKQVFTVTHEKLLMDGGAWLTNTSESCSVVAALIATVAFATAATVPGGVKQDSGSPTLEDQPAFDVFAFTSLVALCFSVTAVIMFLSILTSRYQERDFESDLPKKLLLGLTSLFISIASMLVSFCAGHFFVLKDKLKLAAYPLYAVTCLPVTFFAVAQFPLYFDLIRSTFKKVPQRSYKFPISMV